MALRRRNIEQPHYIILANLSVCNILMSVTLCVHLLPSLLQTKSVMLSKWCICFVPTFGNFMIASQVTWTLLAAERYIFICQEIYYHRFVSTRYICWALGVIWKTVVFLNTYHQLLIYYKLDFVGLDKPLDTLMCDPFTLQKITGMTSADLWLLRGPSGCILLLNIISIMACNLLIHREAHKVCLALRQGHSRAQRSVSCYLGMFLVQLLPMHCLVIMTLLDKVHPELVPQMKLLLLVLMMLSPSVNTATVIYRNKEFKKELRSLFIHIQQMLR